MPCRQRPGLISRFLAKVPVNAARSITHASGTFPRSYQSSQLWISTSAKFVKSRNKGGCGQTPAAQMPPTCTVSFEAQQMMAVCDSPILLSSSPQSCTAGTWSRRGEVVHWSAISAPLTWLLDVKQCCTTQASAVLAACTCCTVPNQVGLSLSVQDAALRRVLTCACCAVRDVRPLAASEVLLRTLPASSMLVLERANSTRSFLLILTAGIGQGWLLLCCTYLRRD